MNDTPNALFRRTVSSPIGEITVLANDEAIVAILWDTEAELAKGTAHNPVDRRLAARSIDDVDPGASAALDAAVEQLDEYFAGSRQHFDLPLAPIGTEFQRAAWASLQRIPFGATRSYGEQAEDLGDRNLARAVGAANGQNPIPIVIPCHRVVGSNGSLTGFAGGVGVKRWLLDHEQGQATLM